MKNTITLEQYKKLETLIDNWQEETHPERDEDFVTCMLTTAEGDGPEPEESAVMATIEAYDRDGNTDFDTLKMLLNKAGVELEPEALLSPHEVAKAIDDETWEPQSYWDTGDASFITSSKLCRCFLYCLVIVK